MRKTTILFLLACCAPLFAQEKEEAETNSRISFVTGIGASKALGTLYQIPVIDKSTNFVKVNENQTIKTNITFGIVYIPYKYKVIETDGTESYVPKGISFSTFINPITLSKSTENQSFFNIVDFGVGIGYKFYSGIMIMGTVEWFGTKQPRQWFIEEYGNGSKQYRINNAAQTSLDINDEGIFENKIITTIGFKVCYTFDIIKDYEASKPPKKDDSEDRKVEERKVGVDDSKDKKVIDSKRTVDDSL